MMLKGIAILLVSVVSLQFASFVDTTYFMDAEVTRVTNDECVVVDETGEEWAFFTNADDLIKGDIIKLEFDNVHTNTRADDEIRNYKKLNK